MGMGPGQQPRRRRRAADRRIRQATVNILADMDASATTIAPGLVASTKSTDTTPPTVTVSQPTSGSTIAQGSLVTVEGHRVGHRRPRRWGRGVDGQRRLLASCRWPWQLQLHGRALRLRRGAIQVRAIDDSANIQPNPAKIAITSDCPCSLFGAMTPINPDTADSAPSRLAQRWSRPPMGTLPEFGSTRARANGHPHRHPVLGVRQRSGHWNIQQ